MPGESIGTRNAVTPCPRSPGPRAREHDRHRRVLGVRDPHLRAGDPIAVRRSHGRRLLIRRIGAGVRLRQREGADALRRAPACAASARAASRVPRARSTSATSELVTDSETATVALARAIASIASA